MHQRKNVSLRHEPTAATYAGFWLLSCVTIALELLFTRVASARFTYHLAFAVISLGMFGLTAGAVFVHRLAGTLDRRPELVPLLNSCAAACFALSVPVAFGTLVGFPTNLTQAPSPTWDPGLPAIYVVMSVPFFFVGISISLLLTRYRFVSRLYAADLCGAGFGGVLFFLLLTILDAEAAMFVLAGVVFVSAGLLALPRWRVAACASVLSALFFCASLTDGLRASVMPRLSGDDSERDAIVEKWNAFSRVVVFPAPQTPIGWGYSGNCPQMIPYRQNVLVIDRAAGSVITEKTSDDFSVFNYMLCDVTFAAHQIRRDVDVMVMGVGGGRDILGAMASGQRSVTAAEINGSIVELLREDLADFVGHFTEDPRVQLVVDEARSYLARSDRRFGIIQASLIDTFAASSAGAFALTENGLYTVEGWKVFLDRLTDDGILTMSRWFYYDEPAYETLRLVSLARDSLDAIGIPDHSDKVVLIAGGRPSEWLGRRGTGTILVKRTPFTEGEIETLESWARLRGFFVVYAPGRRGVPIFDDLMNATDREEFLSGLPVDVRAPTDDKPFFFLMKKQSSDAERLQSYGLYHGAIAVLWSVFLAALALTLLVIVFPLLSREDRRDAASWRGARNLWSALVFLGIGVGFMLVEVAQIQRLSIFLGHPVYSLTVVMTTLLVSSGAGSLLVGRWAGQRSLSRRFLVGIGSSLLALLALMTGVIEPVITALEGASTPARLLAAMLLLAPPGLFMGMMFPLGMRIARDDDNAPAAWFWALNGSASTLASILAIATAVRFGIRISFLMGLCAYAIAVLGMLLYFRSVERTRVTGARVPIP